AAPTAAAAMTLESVTADASHITLHTSGTPAYTSYSPSPAVFVVDLTSTSKASSVAITTSLPDGVSSVTAEDVTEMGTTLTRITFRLQQPVIPTASALEKAIVIAMPMGALAPVTALAAEVHPDPVATNDVPHVEP